jgi:2-polyprenyl-3-methyl-5-hydroxy-6-metoxy-1,4-benzoquinol methylase
MKGYRRDPERNEVRILRAYVPLAGTRILKIGCGNGRPTRRIAGAARSVLAVDPSAAAIAEARRQTPAAWKNKVRDAAGSVEMCSLPD